MVVKNGCISILLANTDPVYAILNAFTILVIWSDESLVGSAHHENTSVGLYGIPILLEPPWMRRVPERRFADISIVPPVVIPVLEIILGRAIT